MRENIPDPDELYLWHEERLSSDEIEERELEKLNAWEESYGPYWWEENYG